MRRPWERVPWCASNHHAQQAPKADLISDKPQQAHVVSYRMWKMGSSPQQVNREDEPSAVSTRTFDVRVHGPLRQRRQVRGALIASRWPADFACPACGCGQSRSFRREGRLYFQCAACRHQCSVISGTIFEATKLGLSRWFLAMHDEQMRPCNVLGTSVRTSRLVRWPDLPTPALTWESQKAKKSAGAYLLTLALLGSPTWARTRDLRINRPAIRGSIKLRIV